MFVQVEELQQQVNEFCNKHDNKEINNLMRILKNKLNTVSDTEKSDLKEKISFLKLIKKIKKQSLATAV